MRIHLQKKARDDLKRIWRYSYDQWGEAQADKYFDELSKGINMLADHPAMGVACDDVRMGYRYCRILKHLVFYRLLEDRLHIIRVLHEAMDMKQHL